jgi:2-polyprenyl-6-methoxyphenol hydroxylase-like FAD-dependent oxidoreductase
MMLGYLLGRAGIDTLLLEKHADFFRDFRGDTVHPSTLQVLHELGLIDGFLKLPHQQLQKMDGQFGGASVRIADLSRLKVNYPFIAFMPQWDFLNYLRESGKRFASLKIMMNAEATDLVRSGDTVVGVKADTPERPVEIQADLTIGCDGRHSIVRQCADLELEEIGAPMDVLWFRAGRRANETENLFARLEPGKMMVTNRKPVCPARTGQDDGDVRSRRLLAMRLCHRQGTIRCGESARPRCVPQRCRRLGADPAVGDGGCEDVG